MDQDDSGGVEKKHDGIDGEKPLKKARYLWEVKGNDHFRESPQDEASGSRRRSSLQEILLTTADILEQAEDSSDEDDSEQYAFENSLQNEIPVTLVSKNQDYYLQQWQARQIARGFVDNTINTMLENWEGRPLDMSNLVEDSENGGKVEDDAILMAIQSHGLQSSRNETNSFSPTLATNSWSCPTRNEAKSTISNYLHESSADNLQNLQKEQLNESTTSSPSTISNPFEEDLGDPMDFLNAAVSVAIQKKGLTY